MDEKLKKILDILDAQIAELEKQIKNKSREVLAIKDNKQRAEAEEDLDYKRGQRDALTSTRNKVFFEILS